MCPKNTEILFTRTFFSQFSVRHQKKQPLICDCFDAAKNIYSP